MQEKLLASELFKNKKDSYPKSVVNPFKSDRLADTETFKSLNKQKLEFITSKKYLQDQNEKEIVHKK